MMKAIEIKADPKAKAAVSVSLVRQMYALLGGNMTRILGEAGPDWESEDAFTAWRDEVFWGDIQADTSHVLVLDDVGLRGFLSYTAAPAIVYFCGSYNSACSPPSTTTFSPTRKSTI